MESLTGGADKSLDIASDAEKQLNALNDMVSGIADLILSIVGLDGSIKQVSTDIWEASKERNAQAWLQTIAITDENKKALMQQGVLSALGKPGVLEALTKPGVIESLSKPDVLKALSGEGNVKALEKLFKDPNILKIASSGNNDAINTLLSRDGPIAKALGEQSPLVGALGQQGVLGALGQQGVLGALGQQGVLGALGKQGVLGALGDTGVLGALTGNNGLKTALTGNTGSVGSAVKDVKGAIDGNPSLNCKVQTIRCIVNQRIHYFLLRCD
jgi:hypothetical protein